MKRLFAWIIDIVFYMSMLFSAAVIVLADIYNIEHDITIINSHLQTALMPTLLIAYGVIVLIYLLYFVAIPVKLKGTVGQRLVGLMYSSQNKLSVINIFLKVIVGRFWELILFPYSIFLKIKKKDSLSTSLSKVVLVETKEKARKTFYFLLAVFSILFIGALGVSTYVYKTGLTPIVEGLTDYQKQVEKAISINAYPDAEASLQKYKEYNGETVDYKYYNCVISSNLTTEIENTDICKAAFEANADNDKRMAEMTLLQAKTYAINEQYEDALVEYQLSWEKYNDRTMDMVGYIVVLSELDKKNIKETITELSKNVDMTDASIAKDIAELYARINANQEAIDVYQVLYENLEDGTSVKGEIAYSLGELLYSEKKYQKAKAKFLDAKEFNKDFAEAAESYIILIDDLANSIVK